MTAIAAQMELDFTASTSRNVTIGRGTAVHQASADPRNPWTVCGKRGYLIETDAAEDCKACAKALNNRY